MREFTEEQQTHRSEYCETFPLFLQSLQYEYPNVPKLHSNTTPDSYLQLIYVIRFFLFLPFQMFT